MNILCFGVAVRNNDFVKDTLNLNIFYKTLLGKGKSWQAMLPVLNEQGRASQNACFQSTKDFDCRTQHTAGFELGFCHLLVIRKKKKVFWKE